MTPNPSGPRSLLTPAALHILMSLAEGQRHGYRIKQDVEERTGGALRIGPGTLYEGIHRMLRAGWIEEVVSEEGPGPANRRKIYRLTSEGGVHLRAELLRLDEIVRFARERAMIS